MKRLRYLFYFVKNSWFVFCYTCFQKKRNPEHFQHQTISFMQGNALLKEKILEKKPFSAIRFGAVELSCVNNYQKINLGWKKTYKKAVKTSIKRNAGVFPTTDDSLTAYSECAISAFQNCDVLGFSGLHMEDYYYRLFCPKAKPIPYESFEPLQGDWIQALQGQKVLVISPFAKDIEKQYAKKDRLFPPGILPDFSLQVYACVQTLAEQEDPRYNHFIEALQAMIRDIQNMDFDIALVGAGAYGSPLCNAIKEMGKMAIQTGGATQTMFGIIGKRWEGRSHVNRYINAEWIRPTEQPQGYQHVENGCYW